MYKAQNKIFILKFFIPWLLEDQRCKLSYMDLDGVSSVYLYMFAQSPLLLVLTVHLSGVPGPIPPSEYIWCGKCVLWAKMRVCVA